MDLTTLALAKSYTDRQIEKAEMGDIELDSSLTKAGFAADAAAVGEAIKNVDLSGYATEEYVDTEIIANQAIRPFEYFKVSDSTASWIGYVDIEEMIPNVPYMMAEITEEQANKAVMPGAAIVVRCDDDTTATVARASSFEIVYRSQTKNNTITLYRVNNGNMNIWITVDITDKSTKNNIVVTKEYNKWFLPTYASNYEYTPTNDYNPATKKYVDDTVAAFDPTEAVNTALAAAKESGEFDGAQGEQGPKGDKGDKGDRGDPGEIGPQGEPGVVVAGAQVGQTIIVKAIDENGIPTEWEPVDFPSETYIRNLINQVLQENGLTGGATEE